MRQTGLAIFALLALVPGACAPDREQTARVEEGERQIGAEQHEQLLTQFGGAYEGPEADYLRAVGQKLAATAGLQGECTFTLVNSDVVNAFAVPGCYIYLTRGLMVLMNSEAQLAAVLGHELGHVVHDHSEQQQSRSVLRQLGVLAVGLATESELLTQIAGGAAELFTLRYSRRHEHEADSFGVETLVGAGYDPYAAAEMLRSLMLHEQFEQASETPDLNAIPEWGRTHPLAENRIERVRAAAQSSGIAPDQLPEQEQAFLAQVQGLLYGDDPQQGFVLGRRFAHPELRIAFGVPQGFRLTNSPGAVLIEGPGGIRGQFSGGELPAEGLEHYATAVATGAFGRATSPPRASRRSVNGFPALLLPLQLSTSEGPVEAIVAAYDAGSGSAYHFLLVSPPGGGLPDQALDMIDSFSRLSQAEAARLQPRIIDIVRVRPDASIEELASRMATDRPVALLRVLNGMSEEDPLATREFVKVVRFGSPDR